MQICDLWVDPPPPPRCDTGLQPAGLLSVLISIIGFAFLVQFQIPKVKAGEEYIFCKSNHLYLESKPKITNIFFLPRRAL